MGQSQSGVRDGQRVTVTLDCGPVHECKPLPSGKTVSLDDVDEFEVLPLSGVSRVSRMTLPRLATSGKKRDAWDGRDRDMVSFQHGRIGAT